ncbi:MAG: hypothetical protein K9L68_14770 [Spirochaetales bacterium]|nr:hypothetical protein [Spirochaetales bacterium]
MLYQESSLGNDTAAVDFYSYALLDYRRHLIKNQKALDALEDERGHLSQRIGELRLAIESGLRAQWTIRDLSQKIQDQMGQLATSEDALHRTRQQFALAEGRYRDYLNRLETIIKEDT